MNQKQIELAYMISAMAVYFTTIFLIENFALKWMVVSSVCLAFLTGINVALRAFEKYDKSKNLKLKKSRV